MVRGGLQPEEARIEGVVDVGVIVIAHFANPAQAHAFAFLKDILLWNKKCLVPTSAIMGAYHVMTEYLGVERSSAYNALTKTLETRSPAFYEDISVDMALGALENALSYRIESWDGYLVSLAKAHDAAVIFSIDGRFARKAKGVRVVNPLPGAVFEEYNAWLKAKLKE